MADREAKCAVALLDYYMSAQTALQGRILHVKGPYWKWEEQSAVYPGRIMDEAIKVEDECGVNVRTDILQLVLTWDYEDDPLRMLSYVIEKVRCASKGDPCEKLNKAMEERLARPKRGGPQFATQF